jgi:hypothetical protein
MCTRPTAFAIQGQGNKSDLVEHTHKAQARQIGMKREFVEISVKRVDCQRLPDGVTQKRQIQIVASPEDNGVYFLNPPVCEPDRLAVHLSHARLYFNTALGYQRQEMLILRDAGVEDTAGRFGSARIALDCRSSA